MEKTKIIVPLIGKLAVKHAFVTKAQLKRALQICEDSEKEGKPIALPEVLVRTQIIKPGDMKKLHQLKVEYEAKSQKKERTGDGPAIVISEDNLKAELTIPGNWGKTVTIEMII